MKHSFVKRSILTAVLFCLLSYSAFTSEVSSAAFVEGCNAYSKGDWASAEFLLKKAVGYSENQNPDTYYMLITAEVYAGNDSNALDDCDVYLELFPESLYYSRVQYTRGHLLYKLGEYEKAIIVLSDFCHQNEGDDMYSYALFYIGESLFAGYKYDEASAIYQRIVIDFPESEKYAAAQYRIESILQRAREEKLLYLLKQTGEEYLSAKEEYEKQLRLYNADAINTTRQRLEDAQQHNKELEDRIRELENQISVLKIENEKSLADAKKKLAEEAAINAKLAAKAENNVEKSADKSVEKTEAVKTEVAERKETEQEKDVPRSEPYDETKSQITALKKKALDAQMLLDNRN